MPASPRLIPPAMLGLVRPTEIHAGGIGLFTAALSTRIDPAACVRAIHPAPGWQVAFDLDTDGDEILDDVVDPAHANDAMTRCLAETAWQLYLGSGYRTQPARRHHITLDAHAYRR